MASTSPASTGSAGIGIESRDWPRDRRRRRPSAHGSSPGSCQLATWAGPRAAPPRRPPTPGCPWRPGRSAPERRPATASAVGSWRIRSIRNGCTFGANSICSGAGKPDGRPPCRLPANRARPVACGSNGALAGLALSWSRRTSPSLRPGPETRIDTAQVRRAFGRPRARPTRPRCGRAARRISPRFACAAPRPKHEHRRHNRRPSPTLGSAIAALLPNSPRLSARSVETPLGRERFRQQPIRRGLHAQRIVAVAVGRAGARDDEHARARPCRRRRTCPRSGPCGPGMVIGAAATAAAAIASRHHQSSLPQRQRQPPRVVLAATMMKIIVSRNQDREDRQRLAREKRRTRRPHDNGETNARTRPSPARRSGRPAP